MRRLASKRGISTVLSSVIMILVVVIGMSVAFAYFTGYVKDFQTGRGGAIMEMIEVEDVWFKDQQTINITIYNYGKAPTNIVNLYINNNLVNFNGNGQTNLAEIPVGGHSAILVTTYTVTAAKTYHFKLVSTRGSAFEGNYLSPSTW